MDNNNERIVSEKNFRIARNFVDKLDILMELQDKSEDNEAANLVKYTRSAKDLKIHFLLDDANYRISAEKVFDNFFNTFVNANKETENTIKQKLYNSYSSLYEVIHINSDEVILRDLLLSKNMTVVNSNLESLGEGDYLFARIINFNETYYIVHVLNILNEEIGNIFYNMIFEFTSLDFKNIKKENRKILMLKESLMDIFIVFGMAIKSYEEVNNRIEEEIERENIKYLYFNEEDVAIFESFLDYIELNTDFYEDDSFYLLDIVFREFLDDIDENFSTFENYSYIDIFDYLADNGAFLTNTEFYNTLFILKKMYKFFNSFKIDCKKPIAELEYVSNNIFNYQNTMKNSFKGFYFDEGLLNIIPYDIESKFIDDFEDFIKYIELMNVLKSETKDVIIPTHIKNLSDELNLVPTKNVKNLNQTHYPTINFFYNFAKTKSLIEIDNTYILPASRINKYMSLTNQEKYALFLYNILNKDFLLTFISEMKYKSFKDSLVLFLESLTLSKTINIININLKKDKYFILDTLKRLNLVIEINSNYSITPLGEKIYNYYLKVENNNKVISLDKYKKDL